MNEREGALLSVAWSAAVTASSDAARFRRGREYLREQAVMSIEVLAGQLIGLVQGSRAEAYEVVVTVPVLSALEGPVPIGRLVPGAREFRYGCTCPDWDDPCKHAVAVALAFGERLRLAPEELQRLRGVGEVMEADDPAPATPREAPGRRGHLRLVTSQPAAEDPTVAVDVVAFLSAPAPIPTALPSLAPVTIPSRELGPIDVGDVVNDALHWLGVAYPLRR